MNKNFVKMFFTLSFLFSILTITYSQDGEGQGGMSPDIKEQQKRIIKEMDQRLPELVKKKNEGVIGENSRGYVAFVNSSGESETQDVVNIINEENANRNQAYALIADYMIKDHSITIEDVAKQRAKQLRIDAPRGHYIEVNGSWIKKENYEEANDIK